MKTRRLNSRVEIIGIKKVKNNEGKYIEVETVLNTIYCEPLKSTIKEFVDRSNGATESEFDLRKNSLNLVVRYQQKVEIVSEMKIRFKGHTYKIIKVEPNHAQQDYTLLGCEYYG